MKKLILAALASVFLLVQGCSSTPHREIHEARIGMTKEQVLKSAQGSPRRINRTTTRFGTEEQWVYDYSYLYFDEDGILRIIQRGR